MLFNKLKDKLKKKSILNLGKLTNIIPKRIKKIQRRYLIIVGLSVLIPLLSTLTLVILNHIMLQNIISAGTSYLIIAEEEDSQEIHKDEYWWDENFNRPLDPNNGDGGEYEIPAGVYPSNPDLAAKAQILELIKEVAKTVNMNPKDLFTVFYAEHGAAVHFTSNMPNIYTELACVSEYSTYFGSGDVNFGAIDTTQSVKYGPMQFEASKLESEFKTIFNSSILGAQSTATAPVMSQTGGTFARPHPLYFPDAVYNAALRYQTFKPEFIEGTTELDSVDFDKIDLRVPCGLTSADFIDKYINGRLEIKKKNKNYKGSILAGQGSAFLEAEKLYGVNALFLLALAGEEGGWGTSQIALDKNNTFGWAADDSNPYVHAGKYDTPRDGILAVAQKISQMYVNSSTNNQYTIWKMNHSPEPYNKANQGHIYNFRDSWRINVSTIFKQIYKAAQKDGITLSVNGSLVGAASPYDSVTVQSAYLLYDQWYKEVYQALIDEGKLGGTAGQLEPEIGGSGLNTTDQKKLKDVAMAQVGKDYKTGGVGPESFDCSGLVVYVFKEVGITLDWQKYNGGKGRASSMSYACTNISWNDLQPGDLIFRHDGANTTLNNIGHVMIYVGNGEIVHASDYGIGVVTTTVSKFSSNSSYRPMRPNSLVATVTGPPVQGSTGNPSVGTGTIPSGVSTANKDLSKLYPKPRAMAAKLIEECARQGITIRITEGYRSPQRQAWLYAQGRPATPWYHAGNIVTNLNGTKPTPHLIGCAIDVCINMKGVDAYNVGYLKKVGKIGESIGFEWGGSWTSFVDMPHFQYTYGLTSAQIAAGQLPNDTKPNW